MPINLDPIRPRPYPWARPMPSPEVEPECAGCGAPLELLAHRCSWCLRKTPLGLHLDSQPRALLEVTSLDDPSPRYVAGWGSGEAMQGSRVKGANGREFPRAQRPEPPPSRIVRESGPSRDGTFELVFVLVTIGAILAFHWLAFGGRFFPH